MEYIIKAIDDNTIYLDSSIKRILQRLSEYQHNYQLMICDNISWKEYYTDDTGIVEKNVNEGMGFSINNVIYNDVSYYMVIINCLNCKSINLSNEEFDTIIAHELGHLLNVPNPPKLPYVISPESYHQITLLKDNYKMQKEFYADYFAVTITSKDAVLSAIEKLINSAHALNQELFNSRIIQLRNNEVFHGTPSPVKGSK